MSVGVGKITGSAVSATNENTIALVNLNLDFSLIKCEAPQEFAAVGRALSSRRRSNAEDGSSHKAARKLGALFEQLIPSTPKLLKAYGSRASDIIESPGINPKGTPADGPFEGFVGTDCTSMWAAATSGPASLGIHLLACMLARAWDAKEATSIWVELVRERQREIEKAVAENQIVATTTLIAARQDISRSELGNWDASARSWLRRADQAKMMEHNQFLLIVKNVNLQFGATKTTYHRVLSAWTVAMACLEKLLEGLPQQISDRAVLLALSAWHLYPDLVVFSGQAVPVKFKDPLLPKQAIMTLGLESFHNSSLGMVDTPRWSLSLSHLRYYGDPVQVESNADMSRVNFLQLHLVALGGILANWGISRADMFHAVSWMKTFWKYLDEISAHFSTGPSLDQLSWLRGLAEAATYMRGASSIELKLCMSLLDFGRRRARNFLTKPALGDEHILPFFGLCNSAIMAGLSEEIDVDAGIRYLREIAKTSPIKECKSLICFIQELDGFVYYEYATARPHERKTEKRLPDGTFKPELVHARWIGLLKIDKSNGNLETAASKLSTTSCDCESSCAILCTCRSGATIKTLYWNDPPILFQQDECHATITKPGPPASVCQCLELRTEWPSHVSSGIYEELKLELCTRSRIDESAMTGFSFYVMEKPDRFLTKRAYVTAMEHAVKTCVKPEVVEEVKTPMGLKWELSQYHASTMMVGSHKPSDDWFRSLGALFVAAHIYRNVSGTSVSLKLASRPLHKAHWIPVQDATDYPIADHNLYSASWDPRSYSNFLCKMRRENTFACIAMFESGELNILPSELQSVVALCSDNSIFVAGVLLNDPSIPVQGIDVRHIVGNIGHAGMTMMISPDKPRVRPRSDNYNIVQHAMYDFKREDNFKGTSLHLSFTEWKLALSTGAIGVIDQEVHFLESVVSLWDRGQWVADLDVLGMERNQVHRIEGACDCGGSGNDLAGKELISLDSWEELLDPPGSPGILRAHGNWAARLGVVCLLIQKKQIENLSIMADKTPCWSCLGKYSRTLSEFIID
ncbi:hypothetical protein BKA61DRAFT_561892 [Leptodontidium sp. MPI-SDFR-AT-0119]|nr:hypothetical protein BKA61DRAFT_561892 [Leptodontidium sp. MPI-SDFR-AT-0119]